MSSTQMRKLMDILNENAFLNEDRREIANALRAASSEKDWKSAAKKIADKLDPQHDYGSDDGEFRRKFLKNLVAVPAGVAGAVYGLGKFGDYAEKSNYQERSSIKNSEIFKQIQSELYLVNKLSPKLKKRVHPIIDELSNSTNSIFWLNLMDENDKWKCDRIVNSKNLDYKILDQIFSGITNYWLLKYNQENLRLTSQKGNEIDERDFAGKYFNRSMNLRNFQTFAEDFKNDPSRKSYLTAIATAENRSDVPASNPSVASQNRENEILTRSNLPSDIKKILQLRAKYILISMITEGDKVIPQYKAGGYLNTLQNAKQNLYFIETIHILINTTGKITKTFNNSNPNSHKEYLDYSGVWMKKYEIFEKPVYNKAKEMANSVASKINITDKNIINALITHYFITYYVNVNEFKREVNEWSEAIQRLEKSK